LATCTQVDSLLQAYLDGELAPSERAILEQHLSDCGACSAALRRQRALAAELFEVLAPARLEKDLCASVMAHLPEMDHAAVAAREATLRAKTPQGVWRWTRLIPVMVPALLVVLGLAIMSVWPAATSAPELPVGMLTHVSGEALLSDDDSTVRRRAQLEAGVEAQTRLETEQGARVQLALVGNSTLKMAPSTRIRVHDERHVSVARGAVWLNVGKEDRYFRVGTPTGDVTVFGTTFGVEVLNGRTVVTVVEGTVQVENDVTLTVLEGGKQVSVELGETPLVPRDVDAPAVMAWAEMIGGDPAAVERFARIESERPARQLRAEQVFVVNTRHKAVSSIRLDWKGVAPDNARGGFHVYVYDATMQPLFRERVEALTADAEGRLSHEVAVPLTVRVEDTPVLLVKVLPDSPTAPETLALVEVTASGI
jgi:anti-sigma factor RsiW